MCCILWGYYDQSHHDPLVLFHLSYYSILFYWRAGSWKSGSGSGSEAANGWGTCLLAPVIVLQVMVWAFYPGASATAIFCPVSPAMFCPVPVFSSLLPGSPGSVGLTISVGRLREWLQVLWRWPLGMARAIVLPVLRGLIRVLHRRGGLTSGSFSMARELARQRAS